VPGTTNKYYDKSVTKPMLKCDIKAIKKNLFLIALKVSYQAS